MLPGRLVKQKVVQMGVEATSLGQLRHFLSSVIFGTEAFYCQRSLNPILQKGYMASSSSMFSKSQMDIPFSSKILEQTVNSQTPFRFNNAVKNISYSRKQNGILGTTAVLGICRYIWTDMVGRGKLNSFTGIGMTNFRFLHSSQFSAGAAHEISFDGSVMEEPLDNSTISSDQKGTLVDRTLKLLSGSCYLPHPDKEETGGEDAHLICVEEQAIGVADGVGGWADVGINSGQYSRELMSNSVAAIQEEPKGFINPSRVLEKAHSCTTARGSSTACIIALTEKGVHAVNLGDSGFIVVRDGCTTFKSPVQQHDFNFTYQLECGNSSDLPSSAQVFTFPVAAGDVIIAGTDGLFDNLYNNEIIAVVVHAIRAGLGPQVSAQKIAALARQRALDKNRQTPFSSAAQDAGYRYYGGKLDDITVVVSYITASSV